jgi:hypothetical protein
MPDRKASLLTNKQREYIQGEREDPPSNESQFKGRIRERVEQGMFDFYLLFEYLDQEEVRKTFGNNSATAITPHEEATGEISDAPPTASYVDFAIAFFLRGLNDGDKPFYPKLAEYGEPQPAFANFIQQVEYGIERYLREEKSYLANVSVEIEFADIDHTDELLQGNGK